MALALDRYLARAPRRDMTEDESAEEAQPLAFLAALPVPAWLVFIGCVQVILARITTGIATPSHLEGELIVTGHRVLDHLRAGVFLTDLDGAAYHGAPGLYPVLAAALDSIGGIRLVRDFGILCVFLAVIAVYALGREIFGRTAGLLGAVAFALAGTVVYVSQLASFDAPAIAMVAAAAWLASYGARFDGLQHGVFVSLLLTVATLLDYTSAVFIVPVATLAGAIGWYHFGFYALRRAAIVAATAIVGVLLCGIMWAREVLPGIARAIWDRTVDVPQEPVMMALGITLWLGPLLVLAVLGASTWLAAPDAVETETIDAPTSSHPTVSPSPSGTHPVVDPADYYDRSDELFRRQQLMIIAMLFLGAVMVPLMQVMFRDNESLASHVAFSAIFLAPLAGDFLSRSMTLPVRPEVTLAVFLLVVGFHGWYYAGQFRTAYPADTELRTTLTKALRRYPDRPVLADAGGSQLYYFRVALDPARWHDLTRPYAYQGATGFTAFSHAIRDGHFGVIYTATQSGPAQGVAQQLADDPRYTKLASVPQTIHGEQTGSWTVWVLSADPDLRSANPQNTSPQTSAEPAPKV